MRTLAALLSHFPFTVRTSLAALCCLAPSSAILDARIELAVVNAYDGYAIDQNGDESGDVKIIGSKINDMPIGESTADSTEARVWLPFRLSETDKQYTLQAGVSATLVINLTDKQNAADMSVSIHGAGYRSAIRVNQSDYATLSKELVPNAINENTPIGELSFDVTDFIKEEAARPDADGIGLGFLLRVEDETVLPNTDGLKNAFFIGSSRLSDPVGYARLVLDEVAPVSNPVDPDPPDPAAVRVLIIGNSILKNSPLPNIGWAGNWGMAASAPGQDFAHLLMARIEDNIDRPVEFMLHNMAFWENTWRDIRHDIPLVTYARDFNPHIILSCISENTGLLDSAIPDYKEKYRDMIGIIAGGESGQNNADVIVRGSFWTINGNTDQALSEVAAEEGYPYVRCDFLSTRSNQAWEADYYLGPDPVQDSVLNHPNDLGMQAIADEIWNEALEALILSKYKPSRSTDAYFAWDAVFGSETDVFRIGPDNDYDLDGASNFLEYALMTDPMNPSDIPGLLPQLSFANSTVSLNITAISSDPSLAYQLEWSHNLSTWHDTTLSYAGGSWQLSGAAPGFSITSAIESDTSWQLEIRFTEALTGNACVFFRAQPMVTE